jgi:hypothetical protein
MYVQRNIEDCSCNHCCSGKAICIYIHIYIYIYIHIHITYSEYVFVALGIQHAMRACVRACAMFLSVTCPYLQYFSTLYHKRHDFRKKNVIEYKMCILIFSANYF